MFKCSDSYAPEDDGIDEALKLPANWPYAGTVQFQNVRLRYKKGGNLALKNVSATIPAGNKVIVVGRTGAGKSSLITATIRLIKLEGGKILIDGHDISNIATSVLRSKVSVIPQDPILLRGDSLKWHNFIVPFTYLFITSYIYIYILKGK